MSKKKKKSKIDLNKQPNRRHVGNVRLGDLNAEERSPGINPALAEAIDAAFDEGVDAEVAAEIDAATVGKTSAALRGTLSQRQDSKKPPFKTLLDAGGSMVVAILLMALLMIILGWATFVENAYGANISQYAIYRTWWFDVLLALLGANVLCSMLARLPWRRRHVPFVIAHLGILVLLIGCLVTSRYGVEAQLTVYEGELGRFAQKTSGDEIGLEIINFRKTAKDETQNETGSDKPEESAQERMTRELLAAQRDPTRNKPAAVALQPELDVLDADERLQLPVTLGPISWREYASENWFAEKTPVFWKIYAPTEWVYAPLCFARRSSGCVYDKDGVRVDLVDYMADSRMKPAQQLKLRIKTVEPPTEPNETESDEDETLKLPQVEPVLTPGATNDIDVEIANRDDDSQSWSTHELPIGLTSPDMQRQDPYLALLPYERISYRLAKSNAETEAFLEMIKQPSAGTWGNVVLRMCGQTHAFAVDDLINRQTQFGTSVNMTRNRMRSLESEATELRLQLFAPDEDADVESLKRQITDKETAIEEQKTELAKLNSQIRMPIGETGLTLEMTAFRPEQLQMILVAYRGDETAHVVALAADQPLISMVPEQLGMQAMHVFDPHEASRQPGYGSSSAINRAMKPRLDLLQGRDQKLYYRFWDGRNYSQSGELPTDQSVTSLPGDDGSTLNVSVETYEPHDYPGVKLVAEPYKKPESSGMQPIPCVKVRVRADGIGDETYWLQKTPYLIAAERLQEHQIGYVPGENRTLAVTFPYAWLDLGFSLFLHKFERKLEPGIGMPSHFSSLVSVYPIDDEAGDTTDREPLHDRVLIRMNQPGMFSDQTTGRKYRVFQTSYQGPYHPGMSRYEANTGGYVIGNETRPRESLYASTLTANYDPGRGLKYLGCLMIVLGSLALFYTKKVRRKIGLTSLESTVTDISKSDTRKNHDDRYAKSEARPPRKRLLFGHVIFCLIVLPALGTAAVHSPVLHAIDKTEGRAVSPRPPRNRHMTDHETRGLVTEIALTGHSAPLRLPVFPAAVLVDGFLAKSQQEEIEKEESQQETQQETVPEPESIDESEPENETIVDETHLSSTSNAETAKTNVAERPAPPMPEPFDAANVRVSTTALDWRAWEELPVFYDGRIMPLATFSRITVTSICGQGDPTLRPDERVLDEAVRDELLTEREVKRIRAKFTNGPRRFRNGELVFSWLVEPEAWEYIPFLSVKNRELRIELNAETTLAAKDMPEHVSPYQVKKYAVNMQRVIDQWRKLEAEKLNDAELEKMGEDGIESLRKTGPAAIELQNAYTAYRMLTNEANALPAFSLYRMLAQADRQAQLAYRMQLTLERMPVDFGKLGHMIPFSGRNELGTLQQDIGNTLSVLQRAMRDDAAEPLTTTKLEAAFEKLIVAFDRLLPEAEKFRDAMFALDSRDVPQDADLRGEMIRMLRNQSEQLYYSMRQSRQWCEAAYLAIYDGGSQRQRSTTLQVFPALVAESIKTDRSYPSQSQDMFRQEYSETNRMPTWLTLHTFLFASDDMIRRFAIPGLPEHATDESNETQEKTRLPEYDGTMLTLIGRVAKEGNPRRAIRKSFHEMAAAYLALEYYDLYVSDGVENDQRRHVDRAEQIERFNRASLGFAGDLRANAEATVEMRRNLVSPEVRDDELLAKTSYPTRKLMRAEYDYERMRPFYLMWVTSAAALTLLLFSAFVSLFDRKGRKIEATLFWCGFAMLIASEIVTLVGACYRAYITGWAPVTNMFETIVLMAFSVAAIGIWYAFQPLFGERLLRAWRVAALPKGQPRPGERSRFGDVSQADERRFFILQRLAFLPRLALSILVLYYVMLLSYGEAGDGRLTWQIVRDGVAIKDPIDMGVVAVSIALITWLVPRALTAAMLFPFVGKTKAPAARKATSVDNDARVSLHHVLLNRKLFLIVGAALALAAGLAAYFNNTTFSPNIRPLMAVLRSNFWLTVHVFAIIIGYASGAIAWLLAVIACASCIFGRWRTTQRPDGRFVAQIPDRAESLMPYIISMLRWTMILIAIGTMLGARWADYSWGRFWGWDPKEVWALVTLLFYLIVLHGRAARYYGNFGVMLGALFGAIAIIMTWYGANVIFKGSRHAYGGADTGIQTMIVWLFIGLNLFWGLLAVMRYIMQKADADAKNYINPK